MLDKAGMGKFIVGSALVIGVIILLANGFNATSAITAAAIAMFIVAFGFLGRHLFWK